MSVQALTESRNFRRQLEYTRDEILPGIVENAFDHNPTVSVFAGRLSTQMFGGATMQGRGKRTFSGGTTIEVRLNLGQNTTVQSSSSPWGTFDTTPSDTPRHARFNWKGYNGTLTFNGRELRTNRSPNAHADMVENETRILVGSLVDLLGGHLYDNGGVASRVTDLDTIVSADDSVGSLSGATYGRWNSRGLSARGTTSGNVSFSSDSFAAQGFDDMLTAWNNCSEGNEQPHIITTTYTVHQFYEASLDPKVRYQDTRVANSGFQSLMFKSAPIVPDPQVPSGTMWFLNLDHLYLAVLEGADFSVGEFVPDKNSDSVVSPILLDCEMVCDNRFLLNKMESITA